MIRLGKVSVCGGISRRDRAMAQVPHSGRPSGRRHEIGKDTVARNWRQHGLNPWRIDTFKISSDPDFEKKLVDVVGLYIDPPARAVVFSFDEQTQVHALDRTQPWLPMIKAQSGTMTHDYKRHGTTDMLAAMNMVTGEVLRDTRNPRRTGAGAMGVGANVDDGEFSLSVKKSFSADGVEFDAELETSAAVNREPLPEFVIRPPTPLETATIVGVCGRAGTGALICLGVAPIRTEGAIALGGLD